MRPLIVVQRRGQTNIVFVLASLLEPKKIAATFIQRAKIIFVDDIVPILDWHGHIPLLVAHDADAAHLDRVAQETDLARHRSGQRHIGHDDARRATRASNGRLDRSIRFDRSHVIVRVHHDHLHRA